MSVDISKVKAEIKEWQRAYRRAHGRDPGKDELRKNPEMQAKYKIWQDSLKADKDKASRKSSLNDESRDDEMETTPPKSIVPKKMPVQSASTGPATPFSARKKSARKLAESPTSPSSEQPGLPKLKHAIPAPNLSASKSRTASSQSSRVIPFNSASSARHRTLPGLSQSLLDSDSDDDDNPFAAPDPASPTGSRSRRSSHLVSPSKSILRRQTSSAVSTPQSTMKSRSANLDSSPTRSSGAGLPMMTPRTKARKRMRGEEVPATPGDKRRKLGLAAADKPTTLFGEPSGRGTNRLTPENEDDDDEEIIDSPKKKSAFGVNGRVFTSMFDDTSSAVASTKDDEASLRSTPPPPPSESGDSYAPDWEDTHDSADDEPDTTVAPTNTRNKPLFSVAPGKWTQDTWDAPAPGTDLSHLRKGLAKAGAADKGKGNAPKRTRRGSQSDGDEKAKKAKEKTTLSNPFELLPPIPGEETSKPGRRYDTGEPRSKGRGKAAESSAALKKRAKELVGAEGGEEQSDGDELAEFNEVEWRPHGPLKAAPSISGFSRIPISNSQTSAPDEQAEDEHDPTENLPSELRTLLSIQSTRHEDVKADALARDVLAGRSTRGREVWGIGDVDTNDEDEDGERDDWDSEPEGWTGGVEM